VIITAAGIPTGGRGGKIVHIQKINNLTHGEKQYKKTQNRRHNIQNRGTS
jgi:hypothetical protein